MIKKVLAFNQISTFDVPFIFADLLKEPAKFERNKDKVFLFESKHCDKNGISGIRSHLERRSKGIRIDSGDGNALLAFMENNKENPNNTVICFPGGHNHRIFANTYDLQNRDRIFIFDQLKTFIDFGSNKLNPT